PNARLHPLVRSFLRLGNERIALRYSHLHPEVDRDAVRKILSTPTKYFRWSGADLFHATNERGVRQNVVIETNSSPSGQKSMPLLDEHDDFGGYRTLLQRSVLPMLKRRSLPRGCLAVLWDKNPIETTGYASTLAELTQEQVLLVHVPKGADHLRWDKGVAHVLHDGDWLPIRAAFRYVTQAPWDRIPAVTRTAMFNPVLACLAGGRNKLVAAKAYDLFNAAMADTGLRVRHPETIWDVSLNEVPLWVERMGGIAVVKNPYSNAGQGIWTITSSEELSAFMALEHPYERFIVQALIGNRSWTSQTQGDRLYHVGTVPDARGRIYVADLRMMIGQGMDGAYPVAVYARRARAPLADHIGTERSWDMLGTNLSIKQEDGSFTTEPSRLMLADEREFSRLGLGLDDLTEAYLQTVLATHAIDAMCVRLVNSKGGFRRRLYSTLVPDKSLIAEVMP
ncbi:MAG: hypothetical protein ACON5B_04910, partial [Myxococcota bacterium]